MTYDNIKSHKKAWFYPPLEDTFFEKRQGEGSQFDTSPPPSPLPQQPFQVNFFSNCFRKKHELFFYIDFENVLRDPSVSLYVKFSKTLCKFRPAFLAMIGCNYTEAANGHLRPATFLKRRLWHSYFPVNFKKISKNTFFIEHPWTTASDYNASFCRKGKV